MGYKLARCILNIYINVNLKSRKQSNFKQIYYKNIVQKNIPPWNIYIKNAIVTIVLGNVGLHLRISKNSEKNVRFSKKLNLCVNSIF